MGEVMMGADPAGITHEGGLRAENCSILSFLKHSETVLDCGVTVTFLGSQC